MRKLEFIRKLIEIGISVMPLHHRSKEPMLSTWREFQNRLPTDTEYQSWFASGWNNYAVICGWCNLVVLDFDTFQWFDLWRVFMQSQGMNKILETSFKVITSQGIHVYLQTSHPEQGRKRIAKKSGIDVQGVGRYVVGPGCVHPSGTQYVPVGTLEFVQVDSVEQVLPVSLFPLVSQDVCEYHGEPIQIQGIHTEYQDMFSLANGNDTDLISKIKASVRIESLFSGVQRSSVDGRWLKALCPFHEDHKQSAWIDTVRQLAGCQVCGMKPMDAINLFARMHGISERDAVTALAQELNVWR